MYIVFLFHFVSKFIFISYFIVCHVDTFLYHRPGNEAVKRAEALYVRPWRTGVMHMRSTDGPLIERTKV